MFRSDIPDRNARCSLNGAHPYTSSPHHISVHTVLELNTSQVQLTEAELTYNQSIYDYLVAKADLDQVLGKDYIAENEE